MHNVQCTLYSIQYTCTHCTVYYLQCIVKSVQCKWIPTVCPGKFPKGDLTDIATLMQMQMTKMQMKKTKQIYFFLLFINTETLFTLKECALWKQFHTWNSDRPVRFLAWPWFFRAKKIVCICFICKFTPKVLTLCVSRWIYCHWLTSLQKYSIKLRYSRRTSKECICLGVNWDDLWGMAKG